EKEGKKKEKEEKGEKKKKKKKKKKKEGRKKRDASLATITPKRPIIVLRASGMFTMYAGI
ncbi:hypothetical protein HWN77_23195, partial [Escherichia coli]|uniref:hypothetical protein n=1 Tax=Escherichia coli TaxID=562 RepID=UPI00159BD2AE